METFYLFFLNFFFFMIIKSELVLFFYSDGFLGWLGQGGLLCNFHIAIFRDKRVNRTRIPHNDGIFQFCDFFGEYFGKNVSIHFLYTSIHVLKIEFVGGISETRLYFALRRSFLVRGVFSRDQGERRKFRAIPPCSLLYWILV